VTRSPGHYIVYLGCALLILGVFAMLYVRERRVWVWLSRSGGATEATLAMSSNRKVLDNDREFAQLKQALLGVNP
jgi:cytochrome c biogenesis protein